MSASLTSRVAELNDELRRRVGFPSLNGHGSRPVGLVMLTRGVVSLEGDAISTICQRVREFDSFTKDNDPYGEHDFGAFDVIGVGKIFWKIDVYADSSCQYGSEAPHDPMRSFRVITIMLAEEY